MKPTKDMVKFLYLHEQSDQPGLLSLEVYLGMEFPGLSLGECKEVVLQYLMMSEEEKANQAKSSKSHYG